MFHISPKPHRPGAVIRSRPFLPDARVISSVAGGAPFVPFLSKGAFGVRELQATMSALLVPSQPSIIRLLTMGLGDSTTKTATQGTFHPKIGTCRYTTFFLCRVPTTPFEAFTSIHLPNPSSHLTTLFLPRNCVSFAPNSPFPRVRNQAPLHTCRIG
jgi:hypothetical protein